MSEVPDIPLFFDRGQSIDQMPASRVAIFSNLDTKFALDDSSPDGPAVDL